MTKYILAIDQGTTSTTALLLSTDLQVKAKASTEILPTYPQYGWVEHDLSAIWSGTLKTIEKLLQSSGVTGKDIACIGITNQRETVGAWDRKTGEPLHKAIVWQCRRTADRCAELRKDATLETKFKEITGLVLDPYFSGTKIEWLLKNVSGLPAKASNGDAIFGNIDTYLLFRLTGNVVHATDVSNASRTLLMSLKSLQWEQQFLDLFQIPLKSLPKICSSSEIFGVTKGLGILPDGIPIAGILGDQQAALFGQLCTEVGEAKITYGTGAFFMCNTGSEIRASKFGMLTTVAWKIGGKTTYALEGSAFVAGAAVQFLRDNLGIIKSAAEVETLALQAKEEEMGELLFVPALTGLGAPYWNAKATGMIQGLTRGTQKSHFARATLEGIALQNDALITAVQEDLQPHKLRKLRVDGGASANSLLMQLQSDLANLQLDRPQILETTALGSALAAGLGVGIWSSLSDLKKSWRLDRTFEPHPERSYLVDLKKRWAKAVARVQL